MSPTKHSFVETISRDAQDCLCLDDCARGQSFTTIGPPNHQDDTQLELCCFCFCQKSNAFDK
eukprot:664034-Amphidinium_carterae.1